MTIFGVTLQEKYRSRKFLLATVAALVSHVALFLRFVDGSTWVAAQTMILGLYAAADVLEHKVNIEGGNT